MIDWSRPGKDTQIVAKNNLCKEDDFDGSEYLQNQWNMFKDRYPLCLDSENDIMLSGGKASNNTKAFSINIKKCIGPSCLSSAEVHHRIDGLIITVLAIQDHVDFKRIEGAPIMKVVKVVSQTNL